MATPQSALTKTAVLGTALALAGLGATSAQAQEARATRAPAYVDLTVASASAPIYAKPTSSSTRYRSEPRGTTLRIACSTTATPSGNLWYRIYDSQPVAWVWSGHFPSLVQPPKKC